MSEKELTDTKKIIRATLISSPDSNLTVNELCCQYWKIEENEIPFRKFNFRSAYEFLRSIPDTVELLEPNNINSYVRPVTNERTQHIRKLVLQQKPSSKKYDVNHRSDLQKKHFQRQRPILNNDFKKDVFKLLQKYPTGMCWDVFDSHIQRILTNHYLTEYDSEEVLKSIVEFAFCHNGRVFLNENQKSDGYPFISQRLQENLRNLMTHNEYANGIWLTELTRNYELKFGYPLRPKEYGFTDLMDLVANLNSIFYIKQCRAENDYLLLDARKFSQSTINKEGKIPKNVIEELKKMLRQGPMYTDDLLQEYRRTYQRELQPENFGFKNLDSFLRHLEDTCKDIVFRETLMKLNCISTDTVDVMLQPSCDILPERFTYSPFPPEVCNGDFRLETDPDLAESKKGLNFGITFGDVSSPAKFYITHINKVKLLESMMKDLNEFYKTHGEKYRVFLPLVSRNLLCACVYSKNSEWHRVRVLSSNLTHVKIFFIDYGTVEENVNIEKLRYLHKDFAKFPALCMQAKLSGIEPKDDSCYNIRVCQKFYKLLQNVQLEVEIVRVTSNYLEVFLHARAIDCRMAIHDILISHHLVKRKEPEMTVSSLSNTSNTSLERLSENKSPNEEKVITKETSSRNNIENMNNDNVANEALGTIPEQAHEMQDSLSSIKVSLKSPPGIPFLPRSCPHEMYHAQIQTVAHIPYSLYGHLCSSPYSYCSGPSIMYSTYCMSQYLNIPHLQYLEMAHFPNLCHPPPGIDTSPICQNNILQNNSSSLYERSYSMNLANSPPAKCSPVSSITSSYETYQSGPWDEGNDAYSCKLSQTKGVSSELAEMNNDVMKEMLEKFVSEQTKKAIRSPEINSMAKSKEPTTNVCVSEDTKSMPKKDAVENELKEYFQSSDFNEPEEDSIQFSAISGRETPPLTRFQIGAYASESVPKTKPKIETRLNDSKFSPNISASTMKRRSRNEGLDSIRSFVLQQVKNKTFSLEK